MANVVSPTKCNTLHLDFSVGYFLDANKVVVNDPKGGYVFAGERGEEKVVGSEVVA